MSLINSKCIKMTQQTRDDVNVDQRAAPKVGGCLQETSV